MERGELLDDEGYTGKIRAESEQTGTGNAEVVAAASFSAWGHSCSMRYYSRSTLVSSLANGLENAVSTVKNAGLVLTRGALSPS